ncbi:sushi, von Willebrand factor type A, EGF and pentraxin domain-containing protein 1-like [Acanthaster planci]|uniref:Sushi, von Willebrand factor type A, EGF and pentraxin domain-containing protein 1-like n=1 Tax=Acanthaster planci TaxID=133434 RepID=A0A8B7YIU5_ACAPL|nr:sushi, von Willebrand factor type A, EGF and pentraxin domain-containing protein 1-like [Acanthaster planci]
MYDTSVNQTLCDNICHKPFNDTDYGCCDFSAKCTCSLVGGRHDCVCGPGTYGRSGFLYECKLCPRGSYKSTYEPTDGCTPCPPDSTTTYPGSQTVAACECKEGYEGNPQSGEPCRIVSCPPLTSLRNGRILPAPCDNKYQSVCSFECDVGYELQDPASAKRRCQADGHWTETVAQCRKVQCPALIPPPNGLIVQCRNQEAGKRNVYDTTCSFRCNDGFNPVGNRERTCTASGEWSGNFSCTPITCPAFPPLRHGSTQPSKCSTRRPVNFICLFKCKDGFKLRGPSFKTCEAGGSWSRAGEEVACVDDTPPEIITCPRSVVKDADPGLSSAEVSWDMPTFQDNLDRTDALTVMVTPDGLKSPHRFEIGSVVITYNVTDRAGLSSLCLLKVVIRDTEPPTVDSCPGPIIDITSKKKTKSVSWDEPEFADNSKQELNIEKTHEQGADFTWGSHIVTYTARDGAGLSIECQFTIRLGPTRCPNYPDPRNGARACDAWLFGQFCRIFCNAAFDFSEKPANYYICSHGKWRTVPPRMAIPWPDCSERAAADGYRRGMESQYYAGDCSDEKAQRAIKEAFVEDFKKSVMGQNGGCVADNACTVEYVTVYCGEIDEDRRRRRRRQTAGDETDFGSIVTLDFTVSTRIRSVAENKTLLRAQQRNAEQTLDEISWDYERLAQAGQLRLLVENETLPVVEGSVTINESVPLCRRGSVVLNETDCLSCTVGSYFDSKTETCKVCAEGTYQDEEGQDECKPCPWGTWTDGPQAKDVNQCRPECKPGTFSPTGLATCRPCSRGFFQPSFKQTACLPCREGTTTSATGSRSSRKCQAVCGPGTFSATGLHPCQPCPLGSYQPAEQQTQCIPCAGSGTTAFNGSTSGEECIEIDACESSPCQNGAVCNNDRGTFNCLCMTGFTGTTCEIDIDECWSQPCLFNGTCVDNVGGFDCHCMPGYEGTLCQTEINECLSDPCQNEARCQDQVNGFECNCVDGFWGPLCENRPDPCAGQACLNGGFCIETPGSFQCLCQSGFKGLRCQTDVNECDLQPCQNGGSCENTPGSYQCACQPGFEGTHCEVNIDECQDHACANGSSCRDVIAGYQCLCPPGVTGQLCETEMSQEFLLDFTNSRTSEFSLLRTKISPDFVDLILRLDTRHHRMHRGSVTRVHENSVGCARLP